MKHLMPGASFSLGNMAIKRHWMILRSLDGISSYAKHHLPVMWKGAVLVCLQRELAGIQQEHSGRRLIALILLQIGLRMRLSNAWIMLNVSRGMTVQRVCFIATHHI